MFLFWHFANPCWLAGGVVHEPLVFLPITNKQSPLRPFACDGIDFVLPVFFYPNEVFSTGSAFLEVTANTVGVSVGFSAIQLCFWLIF